MAELVVSSKLYKWGMLGLEWCSRVLVAEFSIGEKSLDKDWGGETSAYAEIELDIKACRS